MLYKSVLLTMNTSRPPTPWLHQECYNERLQTQHILPVCISLWVKPCVSFSEWSCQIRDHLLLFYVWMYALTCMLLYEHVHVKHRGECWVPSSIIFHLTFLFFFFPCVSWVYLCSCSHVSGYTCVCMHMKAPGWFQNFSWFTLLPYFEADYLSQSESFSHHGSLLASLLQCSFSQPSQAGITDVLAHLPNHKLRFWRSTLILLLTMVSAVSAEPSPNPPSLCLRISHQTCSSSEPLPRPTIFYCMVTVHPTTTAPVHTAISCGGEGLPLSHSSMVNLEWYSSWFFSNLMNIKCNCVFILTCVSLITNVVKHLCTSYDSRFLPPVIHDS